MTVIAVDMDKLDRQAAFVCRTYLRSIWQDEYGLSEEDVLGASVKADQIYLDNTDLPAIECSDRSLAIAFKERDRLYDERF